MVLLAGCVLLVAALTALYIGFAPASAPRLSPERIAGPVVRERRTALTRASEALVRGVESVLRRRGWRPFRAEELELAGIRATAAQMVVTVACFAFAGFAAGYALTSQPLVGLLGAAAVVVGAKVFVSWRVSRRRRAFGDQLAVTLQTMAAALRSGHSFSRAFDVVAKEAASPMAEELARVVNETRVGRDVVASLHEVAERMDSVDFSWVAGAIATQRETGGNLNEILERVAETIRERQHLRQQVRVLSAEGRMSAYVLMALPVFIGVYYAMVASEQMGVFLGTTIGKLMLGGSAVLYLLGGLWMRNVVRIEF